MVVEQRLEQVEGQSETSGLPLLLMKAAIEQLSGEAGFLLPVVSKPSTKKFKEYLKR